MQGIGYTSSVDNIHVDLQGFALTLSIIHYYYYCMNCLCVVNLLSNYRLLQYY